VIDEPVIRAQGKHFEYKGMDTNIGWVDIALNNVENRDVTSGFARRSRNHAIFGLQ
jgi:hypothetical protein